MPRVVLLLLLTVLCSGMGQAVHAVTIDFEGFADSTALTTQIPGLTFTNTTVITSGITLNELEFPPHSGVNVVFDDGGAMMINFAPLVTEVSGFLTYLKPVTFNAFDALNTLVATDTSAFSSNLALSGDPGSAPNEFFRVAFAGGIRRVTIAGDTFFGSSFTLDDLTFTPVPEPATLFLFGSGMAGFVGLRFQQRRKKRR